jgi:hypothetical protein
MASWLFAETTSSKGRDSLAPFSTKAVGMKEEDESIIT